LHLVCFGRCYAAENFVILRLLDILELIIHNFELRMVVIAEDNLLLLLKCE
jgi:hypothetical protein